MGAVAGGVTVGGGGGGAGDEAAGGAQGEAGGEDRAEDEGLGFGELGPGAVAAGGVEDRQEGRLSGRDGADEVVGAFAEGGQELLEGLGGAGEGGVAQVFAALLAAAGAGQEAGGVVPGRLAVGFFDE